MAYDSNMAFRAKLLSFDFVLCRIFVPCMISESKPNKSLACLTLTYYSVQKPACQFHGESSVGLGSRF